MKKIILRHHLSYGQHYYYPVNDEAKELLKMSHPTKERKAFTSQQIDIARKMGMEIEIQPMDIPK